MLEESRLRMALPDSPEHDALCDHLRQCGFAVPDLSQPGLYVVPSPFMQSDEFSFREFEFFRLASRDVATYVEHGICHLGVTFTDILSETRAKVWRPFTFSYGSYPIVLAAPKGQDPQNYAHQAKGLRIATSLPVLSQEIFAARGMGIELVGVEDTATACMLGLADGYVDRLTDVESMLRHGFRVLEVLGHARMKLVVNRACGASRRRAIQKLIELLATTQPPPPEELSIPFEGDEDYE